MACLPLLGCAAGPGPAVVVVGGGYAGLSAISSLRRLCPEARLSLVDSRESHLKITRLHEAFRASPPLVNLAFRLLGERFDFRFIQAAAEVDGERLLEWERSRSIPLSTGPLTFDYLLLAMGALAGPQPSAEGVFRLGDLAEVDPEVLLERLIQRARGGGTISVVGGGATGIQYLFEIAQWLRRLRLSNPLRLIDAHGAPLSQFPPAMGRYVRSRLAELGVDYRPNRVFRAEGERELCMDGPIAGSEEAADAALSFLFTGTAAGVGVETNAFGQVLVAGRALSHVFAAGDCSRYRAPGSNAMSAQSAIRKGKLCARNILRHYWGVPCLEPYLHQDLGYVVSLGSKDGVGWVGCKAGLVAGPVAVALKEMVESQQELLLAGIDTYVV